MDDTSKPDMLIQVNLDFRNPIFFLDLELFDSRNIYVVDLKSAFNFKSVHTHTNAAEERRCIGWQHPILYWEKPILFLWWYATARSTALDCKLRTKSQQCSKLRKFQNLFSCYKGKVAILYETCHVTNVRLRLRSECALKKQNSWSLTLVRWHVSYKITT